MKKLFVYNSLTRKKEEFIPLIENHVGLYVCGPTVYNHVHLGNCRTFVSFDLIYRTLQYLGYRVRYVRNITDVGHLEGDVDIGAEDKISKKARLEELEPMEIVQFYSNGFHEVMDQLNTLPPSIEPRATGHIIEQIEMVERILSNGFAYEVDGSIYFNTLKFNAEKKLYGQLSGRIPEDLLSESRDNLKNQGQKRHPSDFAIWIKADESHIMRWNSPWSVGFPGWHLECSTMSTRYLGNHFDIHGGGYDLKFPHHENEIAQNFGSYGCTPAKYWLHGNMLLMNGRKMSKSDGNTISPAELFSGQNEHITKAYSSMALRFFMLQSHYRSTLDLTDDALQAAERGYKRLMDSLSALADLEASSSVGSENISEQIDGLIESTVKEMCDDFNSPKSLAKIFELVSIINSLRDKHIPMDTVRAETLDHLKVFFPNFINNVLGLRDERQLSDGSAALDQLMTLIIDLRNEARKSKNWSSADKIRDGLQDAGIILKDSPEGTSWKKA